MAAKAKPKETNGVGNGAAEQGDEQETAKKATAGNGFDDEALKAVISQVEGLHGQLQSLRGSYMAECKAVRDDIKAVKREAKDNGIPIRALNKHLKRRELWAKLEAEREEADSDVQDDLDQIEHQLAYWDERVKDLPLFDRVMAESAEAAAEAAVHQPNA